MTIYKGQCEKCKKTAELRDLRSVLIGGTNYRVCENCANSIKTFINNDYILPIKIDDKKDEEKRETTRRYLEEMLRKCEARASLASFKSPKDYRKYNSYAKSIQAFLMAMDKFDSEEKNE